MRVATGATAGLALVPAMLRAFREARPRVHARVSYAKLADATPHVYTVAAVHHARERARPVRRERSG